MSGTPSWAVRGAKVVCISKNGRWTAIDDGRAPTRAPMKGQVYTVDVAELIEGHCYLTIVECDPDECFSIRNFAPVVTRTQQQDIAEFFAGHLTAGQRQPERV